MKKLYNFKEYIDYGEIQESYGFWKGFVLGALMWVLLGIVYINIVN